MHTRLKCLTGPKHFFALFGKTSKAMMGLRSLPSDQRISKQLRERISLAVSGVNDCRYCSWLHTKTALETGLPKQEIDALLSTQFDNVAPDELSAILYAQHWADRDGDVSPEARERVLNEYGPYRVSEMEASIRAVYFGNLCSNTVVASRQAKSEGQRPPVGWLTFILSLPVASAIRRMSGVKGK